MLLIPTWVNDFLKLFFPNNCVACGHALATQEEVICLSCEYKLPVTGFHLHKENPISEVFWGRVNLETATSFLFFNKEGKVQKLMHRLKYSNRTDVGHFLGKCFGQCLRESPMYAHIDFIVPVPLHPQKEKQRGFNQSEVIAKGMSEAMGKPVNIGNLIRKVHTDSQTKKSRYSRWENVRDVFHLNEPAAFVGKQVLLIDDVLTTGATMEACASRLLDVNGIKVSAATLAYAQA